MQGRLFAVTGAPGCGKGTLIKGLFAQDSHIVPMSGMLMNLRQDKDVGEIIQETMESGALVPTEIVNDLFLRHWMQIRDEKKDIVLDGVVRTPVQAEHIADVVSNDRSPRVARKFYILDVVVPLDECMRRLKGRGRIDDQKDEVIERRFRYWKAFAKQSHTALKSHGFEYLSVNGFQSPQDVLKEAVEKIAAMG